MKRIPITDDRGKMLHHTVTEPHPGSVVLTDGEWGTAWQRHFADGLWYSTRGGLGHAWAYMLTRPRLSLVYDADRRPEPVLNYPQRMAREEVERLSR